MEKVLIVILVFLSLQTYAQTKTEYLEKNRFDLTSADFDFPQKDFKLIGFGSYHGSVKAEQAENLLLKSLTKNGTLKYYLPETDYSIGHYFNEYLKTGDTILLKDLILHYGIRVPQDRSIETYKKWLDLKVLNDKLPKDNKLTVVGIDFIVSYKYTSKHLLEIIDYKTNKEESLSKVVNMVKTDTTDFSPYYDSYSKEILKKFVSDYESKPSKFENNITDKFAFNHIISNLKLSFDDTSHRETVIFNNYKALANHYNFQQNPQFLRFGFFHIEKESEGNYMPFFARLFDNNFYKRNEVLSVIGYYTESEVLWDSIYDDDGNYESFTTEAGLGIGDYEKEYFLGIEKKSNGALVKGKSTTDFLDYAILISNSKANTPIEEMTKVE